MLTLPFTGLLAGHTRFIALSIAPTVDAIIVAFFHTGRTSRSTWKIAFMPTG